MDKPNEQNRLTIEEYMTLAFEQAKEALRQGEVPVGCVIVKDGNVIASGRNRTNALRNATLHAEIVAIDQLVQRDTLLVLKGCDLFVTCEPCVMCSAALSLTGVARVFFGCHNERFGGCGSILAIQEGCLGFPSYSIIGGVCEEAAIILMKQFYLEGNPNGWYARR
jgi:tRNA-specific adenosine deaminase 2